MNKINRPDLEYTLSSPSLFGTKSEEKPYHSNRVIMIPISAIESRAFQLRKSFDEVAILALADSIRRHGLLQPILVKRNGKGFHEKAHYACVVGERRLRAFKMLGRSEIPCLVLSSSHERADELTLIENLMRSDLNLFESSAAYLTLAQEYSLSYDDVASHLSVPQADVTKKTQLLRLTSDEQMFILMNNLTDRHARAFLQIEDVELRKKVAMLVVERQYTAKRTEEYIDAILSKPGEFVEMQEDNDDVQAFGNGLNCCLALLAKKGYAVQCERFDHEDEVQFLIRIPTK